MSTMMRLNRLATTTVRTVFTTLSKPSTLFPTKGSYQTWPTKSKLTSTGNFNFIGRGFEYLKIREPPLNDGDEIHVPNDIVLYQLEGCPLSNKVKVFLEYYGIPHKIMEVNPFYEWEIERPDFMNVPVLMVDGEKLVNDSDIIDEMFKRIHPDSAPVDAVTQKWRGWADKTLLPFLVMNTYGSLSGALETHDYIWSYGCYEDAQRFSLKHCCAFYSYYLIKTWKIRHYFWLKQMRKAHNITDDREFLYKAAEEWVDALNGKQYLGGTEPNLGDLAVFGVLRSMRNLKLGKDLVENTRIGEWFTRMEKEMKPGSVKICTLFIS